MSTLIKDFFVELKAITEVSSFAGARVYPLVARSGQEDFIVYTPVTGGIPELLHAGDKGITSQTIQVDIYSRSFATNQTVADSIVDYFNGLSGVINSNTIVSMASVTSKRDGIDPEDSLLNRCSIDINFKY